MGLFAGIFKARDKPKDALGGSRYSFFFGSTSAGLHIWKTSILMKYSFSADKDIIDIPGQIRQQLVTYQIVTVTAVFLL